MPSAADPATGHDLIKRAKVGRELIYEALRTADDETCIFVLRENSDYLVDDFDTQKALDMICLRGSIPVAQAMSDLNFAMRLHGRRMTYAVLSGNREFIDYLGSVGEQNSLLEDEPVSAPASVLGSVMGAVAAAASLGMEDVVSSLITMAARLAPHTLGREEVETEWQRGGEEVVRVLIHEPAAAHLAAVEEARRDRSILAWHVRYLRRKLRKKDKKLQAVLRQIASAGAAPNGAGAGAGGGARRGGGLLTGARRSRGGGRGGRGRASASNRLSEHLRLTALAESIRKEMLPLLERVEASASLLDRTTCVESNDAMDVSLLTRTRDAAARGIPDTGDVAALAAAAEVDVGYAGDERKAGRSSLGYDDVGGDSKADDYSRLLAWRCPLVRTLRGVRTTVSAVRAACGELGGSLVLSRAKNLRKNLSPYDYYGEFIRDFPLSYEGDDFVRASDETDDDEEDGDNGLDGGDDEDDEWEEEAANEAVRRLDPEDSDNLAEYTTMGPWLLARGKWPLYIQHADYAELLADWKLRKAAFDAAHPRSMPSPSSSSSTSSASTGVAGKKGVAAAAAASPKKEAKLTGKAGNGKSSATGRGGKSGRGAKRAGLGRGGAYAGAGKRAGRGDADDSDSDGVSNDETESAAASPTAGAEFEDPPLWPSATRGEARFAFTELGHVIGADSDKALDALPLVHEQFFIRPRRDRKEPQECADMWLPTSIVLAPLWLFKKLHGRLQGYKQGDNSFLTAAARYGRGDVVSYLLNTVGSPPTRAALRAAAAAGDVGIMRQLISEAERRSNAGEVLLFSDSFILQYPDDVPHSSPPLCVSAATGKPLQRPRLPHDQEEEVGDPSTAALQSRGVFLNLFDSTRPGPRDIGWAECFPEVLRAARWRGTITATNWRARLITRSVLLAAIAPAGSIFRHPADLPEWCGGMLKGAALCQGWSAIPAVPNAVQEDTDVIAAVEAASTAPRSGAAAAAGVVHTRSIPVSLRPFLASTTGSVSEVVAAVKRCAATLPAPSNAQEYEDIILALETDRRKRLNSSYLEARTGNAAAVSELLQYPEVREVLAWRYRASLDSVSEKGASGGHVAGDIDAELRKESPKPSRSTQKARRQAGTAAAAPALKPLSADEDSDLDELFGCDQEHEDEDEDVDIELDGGDVNGRREVDEDWVDAYGLDDNIRSIDLGWASAAQQRGGHGADVDADVDANDDVDGDVDGESEAEHRHPGSARRSRPARHQPLLSLTYDDSDPSSHATQREWFAVVDAVPLGIVYDEHFRASTVYPTMDQVPFGALTPRDSIFVFACKSTGVDVVRQLLPLVDVASLRPNSWASAIFGAAAAGQFETVVLLAQEMASRGAHATVPCIPHLVSLFSPVLARWLLAQGFSDRFCESTARSIFAAINRTLSRITARLPSAIFADTVNPTVVEDDLDGRAGAWMRRLLLSRPTYDNIDYSDSAVHDVVSARSHGRLPPLQTRTSMRVADAPTLPLSSMSASCCTGSASSGCGECAIYVPAVLPPPVYATYEPIRLDALAFAIEDLGGGAARVFAGAGESEPSRLADDFLLRQALQSHARQQAAAVAKGEGKGGGRGAIPLVSQALVSAIEEEPWTAGDFMRADVDPDGLDFGKLVFAKPDGASAATTSFSSSSSSSSSSSGNAATHHVSGAVFGGPRHRFQGPPFASYSAASHRHFCSQPPLLRSLRLLHHLGLLSVGFAASQLESVPALHNKAGQVVEQRVYQAEGTLAGALFNISKLPSGFTFQMSDALDLGPIVFYLTAIDVGMGRLVKPATVERKIAGRWTTAGTEKLTEVAQTHLTPAQAAVVPDEGPKSTVIWTEGWLPRPDLIGTRDPAYPPPIPAASGSRAASAVVSAAASPAGAKSGTRVKRPANTMVPPSASLVESGIGLFLDGLTVPGLEAKQPASSTSSVYGGITKRNKKSSDGGAASYPENKSPFAVVADQVTANDNPVERLASIRTLGFEMTGTSSLVSTCNTGHSTVLLELVRGYRPPPSAPAGSYLEVPQNWRSSKSKYAGHIVRMIVGQLSANRLCSSHFDVVLSLIVEGGADIALRRGPQRSSTIHRVLECMQDTPHEPDEEYDNHVPFPSILRMLGVSASASAFDSASASASSSESRVAGPADPAAAAPDRWQRPSRQRISEQSALMLALMFETVAEDPDACLSSAARPITDAIDPDDKDEVVDYVGGDYGDEDDLDEDDDGLDDDDDDDDIDDGDDGDIDDDDD